MSHSDTSDTSEAALAEFYGLSRKALTSLRSRHLTEGVHWGKAGQVVYYTPTGKKRIWELTSPAAGTLSLPGQGFTLWLPREKDEGGPAVCVFGNSAFAVEAGPPAPDVVELRVVRLPLNPRVVIASDGRREDLRVAVGSQQNFKVGMTVPAERVPGSDDGHFRLVGRRPRFPGRW